jgi:hypothetical protein
MMRWASCQYSSSKSVAEVVLLIGSTTHAKVIFEMKIKVVADGREAKSGRCCWARTTVNHCSPGDVAEFMRISAVGKTRTDGARARMKAKG